MPTTREQQIDIIYITNTWTPSGAPPPGALAPHWQRDGIVLLGGPLEDDHVADANEHTRCLLDPSAGGALVRRWFDQRLVKMRSDCELLLSLASRAPGQYPALQTALQLLVFCVAPRADHLFRMVAPSASATLAASVDQLLLETTSQLFGFEVSATRA